MSSGMKRQNGGCIGLWVFAMLILTLHLDSQDLISRMHEIGGVWLNHVHKQISPSTLRIPKARMKPTEDSFGGGSLGTCLV